MAALCDPVHKAGRLAGSFPAGSVGGVQAGQRGSRSVCTPSSLLARHAHSCSHRRDEKTIKALTGGQQQLEYIQLIRSQDPRYVNVWKFHGEREPCRVVSIRALDAYYGVQAPRMGSRLAVQAVVRFDTLQVRLTPRFRRVCSYSSSPPERGDVLQKDWCSRR